MAVQWNAGVLDRLVAPKCSALTGCLAPELAQPYDYFGVYFLNNIFTSDRPDKTRWPTIVFVRRLTNAIQAYRDGREQMLKCVNALQHSSEMLRAYLDALSFFENTIVNGYLALLAQKIVGKIIDSNHPDPFSKGDGSPAQRLNVVYNALKHFDDNLITGIIPDTAPLWLVNDGIECIGSKGKVKLAFGELTEFLTELESDAHFLAVEVFQMAQDKIARIKAGEAH
jgi:hypothetical protein